MRLYTKCADAVKSADPLEVVYPVTGGYAVMSYTDADEYIACVVSDILTRDPIACDDDIDIVIQAMSYDFETTPEYWDLDNDLEHEIITDYIDDVKSKLDERLSL